MKAISSLGAGALALALSFPVFAAGLPQPKTGHGISYMSGGIGQGEAKAMKAAEKSYPLSLTLSAGKHDEYLANVPLTIKNAKGKTLLDAKAGPIVLVKLAAGKYRIAATRRGKTLERTVTVTAKGERRVNLHWPQA